MNTIRTLFAAVIAFGASAGAASAFDRQATFSPRADTRVQVASLGDFFTPQRQHPASTRTLVRDPRRKSAGTITVDTRNRVLYFSLGDGRAIRYGIGVGRQGFRWSGQTRIGRKAAWPSWRPPAAMLKRRPDLPRFMKGGIDNPLGARALYLYRGKRDTLFRIHGTNEPWTIGQAVSSGCIRMLNNDVIDLYNRVRVGASVVVR